MNKRHTHRYRAVLKSERWKALRQRLLQKHVGCQRCKAVTTDLEVHHKHYNSLGSETEDDVELLCKPCHNKADKARAAQQAKQGWWKRVEKFAKRKYGSNWELRIDLEGAAEEMQEWLDRKAGWW